MEVKVESIKDAEVYRRFSNLQKECRKIGRNESADTGKWKYDYVNFPKLRDEIGELFDKYSFFFSQPSRVTEDGKTILQTIIYDSLTGNEFLHSEIVLHPRNENNSQDWGGVITYMRRYQLMSVLGIAADKDDDDYLDEKEIKERIKDCESISELNKLYQGIRKNQRVSLKKEFSTKKIELQQELEESNELLLKNVKIK